MLNELTKFTVDLFLGYAFVIDEMSWFHAPVENRTRRKAVAKRIHQFVII